jgi:hypothetical protein
VNNGLYGLAVMPSRGKRRFEAMGGQNVIEVKRTTPNMDQNLMTFYQETHEGQNQVTSPGSGVMARFGYNGGFGTGGGLYIHPGGNDQPVFTRSQAAWIQCFTDIIALVITGHGTFGPLVCTQPGSTTPGSSSSYRFVVNNTGTGVWYNNAAAIVHWLSGGDAALFSVRFFIQPVTASDGALSLQGAASQTGDILYISDSANTLLSRINKDGYLITKKNAAPANADIATSELAVWLDNTVGATKLMFKGKDTGGTVRTASVVMA